MILVQNLYTGMMVGCLCTGIKRSSVSGIAIHHSDIRKGDFHGRVPSLG